MIFFKRLVVWGMVACLLSGCFSYFFPSHGYLARDSEKPDGAIPIHMPENAPSIVNGYKPGKGHEGLDIIAEAAAPVLAVADGRVVRSLFEPMFGNRVDILHGEGERGVILKSSYLHLQERSVNNGDRVRRGQQIGSLGRTGLLAGGILHLHYELRVADDPSQSLYKSVNPHAYWLEGPGVISCFDPDRHYAPQQLRTSYPLACRGSLEQ